MIVEGTLPAPAVVTVVGRSEEEELFMGTYDQARRRVNGRPLYVQRVAPGVESHFLYSCSNTGKVGLGAAPSDPVYA